MCTEKKKSKESSPRKPRASRSGSGECARMRSTLPLFDPSEEDAPASSDLFLRRPLRFAFSRVPRVERPNVGTSEYFSRQRLDLLFVEKVARSSLNKMAAALAAASIVLDGGMIFRDINGRHYAKTLNVLRETILKTETFDSLLLFGPFGLLL